MTQYLLTIYQPNTEPPPAEFLERVMKEVNAVLAEMKTAGAWVFNGGLHPPSTATVVRVKDGETLVTDGPFVEGKEVIGGLAIVRAPDLDAALAWARKLATALSSLWIEVRPFRDNG